MKRFSKLKNGGIETVKEKKLSTRTWSLKLLYQFTIRKKTIKVYLSSRKFLNGMEISIWHTSDQSQYRSNWAPTPPLTYQ